MFPQQRLTKQRQGTALKKRKAFLSKKKCLHGLERGKDIEPENLEKRGEYLSLKTSKWENQKEILNKATLMVPTTSQKAPGELGDAAIPTLCAELWWCWVYSTGGLHCYGCSCGLRSRCCSWCDAEWLHSAAKAHQAVVCSWTSESDPYLVTFLVPLTDTTPHSLFSYLPISKCPAFQLCFF